MSAAILTSAKVLASRPVEARWASRSPTASVSVSSPPDEIPLRTSWVSGATVDMRLLSGGCLRPTVIGWPRGASSERDELRAAVDLGEGLAVRRSEVVEGGGELVLGLAGAQAAADLSGDLLDLRLELLVGRLDLRAAVLAQVALRAGDLREVVADRLQAGGRAVEREGLRRHRTQRVDLLGDVGARVADGARGRVGLGLAAARAERDRGDDERDDGKELHVGAPGRWTGCHADARSARRAR